LHTQIHTRTTHEDTHIFLDTARERKKKIVVDNFFSAPLSLALALTYSLVLPILFWHILNTRYTLHFTKCKVELWCIEVNYPLLLLNCQNQRATQPKKIASCLPSLFFGWTFLQNFRALFNFYISLSHFFLIFTLVVVAFFWKFRARMLKKTRGLIIKKNAKIGINILKKNICT
jgi:hypothetical protein